MHVRRSSGFLIPLRPFRRLRHPSRHRKRQCRHHWSTRVSSPSANAMGMASKPSRCDWPSTPPQRQSAATTPLRPTSYNSGGCRPAQTPPRAARAPAPGPAGLQAITGANKRTPDGPAHSSPAGSRHGTPWPRGRRSWTAAPATPMLRWRCLRRQPCVLSCPRAKCRCPAIAALCPQTTGSPLPALPVDGPFARIAVTSARVMPGK